MLAATAYSKNTVLVHAAGKGSWRSGQFLRPYSYIAVGMGQDLRRGSGLKMSADRRENDLKNGMGWQQPSFVYFIHVPKTAGTYVTQFLRGQLGDQFIREGHTVPRYALRPWTERFGPSHYSSVRQADCLTVSIVRNPYDLLVSMYLFGFPYWSPRNIAGHRQIVWPFVSFRDYVTKLCVWDDYPWICPEQKKSLFFQLFDEDGSCFADMILRQENLNSGLQAVGRYLGESWNPPKTRVNTNNAYNYTDFYDDHLRRSVEDCFAADLSMFGYSFDKHDERVLIQGKELNRNRWINGCEVPSKLDQPLDPGPQVTGRLADRNFHEWDENVLRLFSGCDILGHLMRRIFRRPS